MNEQSDSDLEDIDLESTLREVRLAQPSHALDRRIAGLFRPRWRMFIGPLSGFAAGILVTVAVFRYAAPVIGHPAPPVDSTPVDSMPANSQGQRAPQPIPVGAMLIESRNIATLGDGEVNGLPIRLEQSQSRLVLFRQTTGGGVWRAEVELPKQTTVRNVHYY